MRWLSGTVALLTVFFGFGCGIKLGSTLNHSPTPTGPAIYQGQFITNTPINGESVTGTAVVYDDCSGNYVTVLNATIPNVSNIQVETVGSSGTNVQQLIYYSGNQNYYFSTNTGSTFTQINLYLPSTQTTFAQALLYTTGNAACH